MGLTRYQNSYGTHFKISRNTLEVLKYEILGSGKGSRVLAQPHANLLVPPPVPTSEVIFKCLSRLNILRLVLIILLSFSKHSVLLSGMNTAITKLAPCFAKSMENIISHWEVSCWSSRGERVPQARALQRGRRAVAAPPSRAGPCRTLSLVMGLGAGGGG